MTETELRDAALIHAGSPLVDGRRVGSPLYTLIPDDTYPSPEVIVLVDRIAGREVDLSDLGNVQASYVWAARVRAHLHRWAVRSGGSLEAYKAARHRDALRTLIGH